MLFQKGNNYWEFRNKHGRNHKYTPDTLWDEAVKYFEWISEKVWNKKELIKSGELAGTVMDIPMVTPMSIEGFCIFADLGRTTFNDYEKEEGNDFPLVVRKIKTIIENQQFEGATVGEFNSSIIARKLGLTDKTDVTTGGEKLNLPVINIIRKSDEECQI